MKKIFLTLLATIVSINIFAGNTVSVSSTQGHPKDTVTITVSLANTDDVTAAEVKIPLGAYLKYVDGSVVLNEERSSEHTLSASCVDSTLSVYVYNLTTDALKGNEGGLFSFKLVLGKLPKEYPLIPTAVLSDATGKALTVTNATGSVTILSPQLAVVTSSINYGHVPIRSKYIKTFQLKNTGNEPLKISGMTFTDTELSVASDTCTIAVGQSKSFSLSYAPIKRDSFKASVMVQSDAINGVQSVSVVADPYSENILTIGQASGICDDTVTISVHLKNMEPIAGYQGLIVLPNSVAYVPNSFVVDDSISGFTAISSITGDTLQMVMYNVNNQPISEGDQEIAKFKLKLSGESGVYTLKPQNVVLGNLQLENMLSSTENGSVTIQSPVYKAGAILDMGNTAVTETAVANYTITNSGKVDLVISKITFLAEGYTFEGNLPITIVAGGSKTVEVSYKGDLAGEYSTTMNVYTNDPDNRMATVTVKGTLYEPNELNLTATGKDSTFNIQINLANYSELVAVQMDFRCNVPISVISKEIEKTERIADMNISCVALNDSVYRIVAYSMSMNKIEGNEGAILTVPIHGSTILTGDTVTVYNIILSNAKSVNMNSKTSAYVVLEDTEKAEMPTISSMKPYIIGYFGMDGRKRTYLHKGLNVVLMSNGKSEKVYVK